MTVWREFCSSSKAADLTTRHKKATREDGLFNLRHLNSAMGQAYTRRSTIIFLISAIALAGLRPLGQVCVQFMMVWQR